MEISLISSSSNPIGISGMHNTHKLLDYILAAIHSLDLQPSKRDRISIDYSHFIRTLILEDRCTHLYRIHQSNEFLNLHWNIAHTVDSRKKRERGVGMDRKNRLQLEGHNQNQREVLDLNVDYQSEKPVLERLNTYNERFCRLSIEEFHHHDH